MFFLPINGVILIVCGLLYSSAGTIYMEECGVSALKRAGDCFLLAGSYNQAAEVYAKGRFFSECLTVCAKGKLFEQGLKCIECWKGDQQKREQKSSCSDIHRIETEYLESCARHYHELGDHATMMKFVKAISPVDAIRNFLKCLGCLDELLALEEELGNFVEAANLAKMKGDLLSESYLLGKGGMHKDASMSILWYVLFNSLSGLGCRGWGLKHFKQKDELLSKAKSYAMLVSEQSFSNYVGTESAILLGTASSLSEVQDLLHASRAIGSLRGEILCSWKILDMHLSTDLSKFSFEDYLVCDLKKYSEEKISENKVFVETLVHSWAVWRDKIDYVIQNLACLTMNEHNSYVEFCLNYLGVLKHYKTNSELVYSVLNPDADWVRNVGRASIRRDEGETLLEAHQLVSAAQKYWGSELIKVGMKVLQILDSFLSIAKSDFCHSKLLTQIFEVATFLMESKFLTNRWNEKSRLLHTINVVSMQYFKYTFPLDWRKSLEVDMICLRNSEVSTRLLKQAFSLLVLKSKPSYGLVGDLAVMILSSRNFLDEESYLKISKCLESNPHWKEVAESLYTKFFSQGSSQDDNAIRLQELLLIRKFTETLKETFNKNWRIESDYISPVRFMYLLERLLLLTNFYCYDCIVATKSCFFEWLMNSHHHKDFALLAGTQEVLGPVLEFIPNVVRQLLYKPRDTIDWIVKSGIRESDHYHRLLVLKLSLLSCVLSLGFPQRLDLVADLLGTPWICDKLPRQFIQILRKGLHNTSVYPKFFANAFRVVNDPLVIVVKNGTVRDPAIWGQDAIFLDLNKSDANLLQTIIPDISNAVSSRCHGHPSMVHDNNDSSCSSVVESSSTSESYAVPSLPSPNEEDSSDEVKTVMKLWRILHALNVEDLQVEEQTDIKVTIILRL